MRLLGATIAGVLVVCSLLLINRTFKNTFDIRLDNSIVRLHTKDGSFFCSGTVISPNLIATAAHCVSVETPFGVMVNKDMQIEIRGADGKPTGIIAQIKNLNQRLDTALLLGDFRRFQSREIVQNPAEIDRILLDPESIIMTCGYPLGGPLVCNLATHIHHFAFMYSAQGWLYPGMSGGPVIDARTGKVLAVNRAVGGGLLQDEIIFNPLVDFLYDMLHG